MATLLQMFSKQLSRLWNYIGTCFMMFWTYYRQRGTIYKYDIGGLLQWQKEEIRRLKEISNGNEVLKKKQCKHLLTKLSRVIECVGEMIKLSSEVQEFGVALEELCCIIQKLGVVSDCANQNRFQAIAFQINNKEAFRELVSDLRCCWDVIYEIHSTSHPGLHSIMLTVDLDMPTLKEIEDDDRVLEERLKDGSNSTWKEYLRQRLGDSQLLAGELDRVEVPNVIDSLKPKLLKHVGGGAFGVVYESRWLGFKCATKILPVAYDNFGIHRKEIGILAGLSHPNLIKFIYCGIGWSMDELCSWTLKVSRKWKGGYGQNLQNLYLVMEFMDMSLSDMLKKRSKPLSYLVAIDIMHQIASGMCYLHDMHVAHRDLNPAHVLMRTNSIKRGKLNSSRYLIKLGGCDASKINVRSKVFKKEKCDRVGTTKYMAPEIILQNLEARTSLFQADVWSFAMTCSEILSQTAPYGREYVHSKDILKKIKEFERPKLPMNCEELTRLIEECWMEDPLQRPTFCEICEKLTALKKMFLRGTYLASLHPEFEKNGALFQKKSRIQKAKEVKEVKEKHIVKVDETTMQVNNMVVGLENNLTKVRDRLKEMRIVGLIGMGGIGKTTLANAIFHELESTYNASCFAKDLKDKSESLGILCDMLKDFGEDPKNLPTNLMDAQIMLEQFMDGKKVLIILDDIRDQCQLDDLLHPVTLSANMGITLIITTRDWDKIKDRVGENGKIVVDTLDENAAEKLFIHHSSGPGSSLPVELRDIVGKIMEVCSGLPLSLRVLGDFLRDKNNLRSWERALQRIKRGRCLDGNKEEDEDMKLWSTLKISFDGLRMHEKNMYLDIACFFCKDVWPKGMSKDRALHVWTSKDCPPIQSFNVLIERSLVNVDKYGHIEMQNQLRDMGRMIVEMDEEYLGTRVWSIDSIPSIHSTRKGTKKVEGIFYKRAQYHLRGQNDCLDFDLSNLQLLVIHDHTRNVSSDFQLFKVSLPHDRQRLCQLKAIVINGNFQQLPKQLWELYSLKSFDIEGLETLEALDEGLGNLTSLTHLNFTHCKRLQTLPEELGNLISLTEFHLKGCSSLTRLPEGLENLTSLTKLDLSDCSTLTTLPEGLGNLIFLTKLNLSNCLSLTVLPAGLGNLSWLTKLHLTGCSRLTTLPEGLGNLQYLRDLHLWGCSSLTTLPWGLEKLSSLTKLNLRGCWISTRVPNGLGNLTSLLELKLRDLSCLTTILEGLGNLNFLTELNLSKCSILTTLPKVLGNLTSLTKLNLSNCSSLTILPEGLGNLISLTKFNLSNCSKLTTLPEGLGNLIFLIELDFSSCSSLKILPEGFGNLTSLTKLDLSNCSSLTTLPEGLGNLFSLTLLDLSNCSSLIKFPKGLGNLNRLSKLDLGALSRVSTVPTGLGNLICLTELNLSSCSSLTVLPEALGNLILLMELTLSNCSSLTTLPEGLGKLTSLTLLDLSNCSSLTTLPEGLGKLTSLSKLDLCAISSLKLLPRELGNLTSLAKLYLSFCSRLTTLPEGLGNLTAMTELTLSNCSSLTTLPEGLGNLTSLTLLDLSYCSSLTTLPEGLGNLTSLTKLYLSNCSSLTTLPKGLGNLTSLTKFYLSYCSSSTTLPEGLGTLSYLTELTLSNCSRLTTLPEGLRNLTSLTKL